MLELAGLFMYPLYNVVLIEKKTTTKIQPCSSLTSCPALSNHFFKQILSPKDGWDLDYHYQYSKNKISGTVTDTLDTVLF